ncbi:MAG TPA: DUF4932 domain-containing protein [Desulfotomaculum sp.]|nr:DUF4932 domain-containing protein [Desulfotomaculum sp.]
MKATQILRAIVAIAVLALVAASTSCSDLRDFSPGATLTAEHVKSPAENIEYRADERLFTLLVGFSSVGFRDVPRNRIVEEHFSKLSTCVGCEQLSSYLDSHRLHPCYYIKYILSLSEPPVFEEKQVTKPLLPELSLAGFNTILAQFYRDADIHSLWLQFQGRHEEEIRRLQDIVPPALTGVNQFLGIDAPPGKIIVIPGLLHWGGYGMVIADAGYLIIGSPYSDFATRRLVEHEYIHIVINPILGENEGLVYESGKAFYGVIASQAEESLSPDEIAFLWEHILKETFARVLTLHLHDPSTDKLRRELAALEEEGHFLAGEINDCIENFEVGRQTIEEFIPECLSSIGNSKEN